MLPIGRSKATGPSKETRFKQLARVSVMGRAGLYVRPRELVQEPAALHDQDSVAHMADDREQIEFLLASRRAISFGVHLLSVSGSESTECVLSQALP